MDIRRLLFPFHSKPVEYQGVILARFGNRLFAAMIDTLWIVAILYPVFQWVSAHVFYTGVDLHLLQQRMVLSTSFSEQWKVFSDAGMVPRMVLDNLFQSLVICGCVAACWLKWGATPGKMLVRVRIADAKTLGRPTRKQFLLRLVGYFLAVLPLTLGILWISFDKRRQGWHDKVAGTVVVQEKWNWPWKKSAPAEPAPVSGHEMAHNSDENGQENSR